MVFFREEALPEQDASQGPKGAQGVALTPGRSIAVDAGSIPYGAPVWLVSNGSQTQLQRLVLAQDTGSAIVGAVRADYLPAGVTRRASWQGVSSNPSSCGCCGPSLESINWPFAIAEYAQAAILFIACNISTSGKQSSKSTFKT